MPIKAGVTASALTASTIVVTATEGCHILKIDGYSHARLLGNGECLRSNFKAVGHTWDILFYPNGKFIRYFGNISIYLKLVDGSKNVTTEVQFSVLPRASGDEALPYTKQKIIHTFESARRNNKCGHHWPIIDNNQDMLMSNCTEEEEEEEDFIIVRCDIKVLNKAVVHDLNLRSWS
ncbi:uncharacterized protein LOC102712741 [Oryza brachyantha]|nr:uncharacterized protein LOC102712741 [Oryza brachyantha]